MEYVKIRVSSLDCPKRFYRVMYVRIDLSLQELGNAILSSLRCEFEHMFYFKDRDREYVDGDFIGDYSLNNCEVDYNEYTLDDINYYNNYTFKLIYDSGDDWQFKIKVFDEIIMLDETCLAITIQAKGDRLWEDHRYDFLRYINGEKVEYRPWNIPEGKDVTSFDDKIDLDALNKETVLY